MGDRMLYFFVSLASILVGGFIGFIIKVVIANVYLNSAENRVKTMLREATLEAESKKKEVLLESKTLLIQERNHFEKETRERRVELQKYEKRILQKEEQIDKKTEEIEKRLNDVHSKEQEVADKNKEVTDLQLKWHSELERISGLTSEQAKEMLIKNIEEEAREDAHHLIKKIEEEANRTAAKKAQEVVVNTIQRLASEITSDTTVASVSLPNDEMKGRIIGREGRNIRALETLIGVDIIIDDTPEAVVISCFDPVRREIAKNALTKLVTDGRIHPTRIEEVVNKVMNEVNEMIFDEGEKTVMQLGIHGLPVDGIIALGRLYYRTSYGQNVLHHSIEVAKIAGMLAAELGSNVEPAKRAGLLHDLEKAPPDSESAHTEAGYKMAKKQENQNRSLMLSLAIMERTDLHRISHCTNCGCD